MKSFSRKINLLKGQRTISMIKKCYPQNLYRAHIYHTAQQRLFLMLIYSAERHTEGVAQKQSQETWR